MSYQVYSVESSTFYLEKRNGRQLWGGKVHSVFNRTINLIDDEGTLYTISTTDLDDAPFTMKVPHLFPNQIIQPGMSFVVLSNALTIMDRWSFDFTETTIVSLLKVFFSRHEAFGEQLEYAKKLLREHTSQPLTSRFDVALEQLLNKSIDALVEAIRGDTSSIAHECERLIGLGRGLTPSGDDFLTGMCLVTSLTDYPYDWLHHSFKSAITPILNRTNKISQVQLTLALEGRARARVLDFLQVIVTPTTRGDIKRCVESVLQIGSSSGADMLRGMITGLELTLELGGKGKWQ